MSTSTLVICGASSDIGRALLARVLASAETRVVAHCHRGVARLASIASGHPDRCRIVEADLSNAEGCASLVTQVASTGWQPTHFVHLSALPLVYERFEKFDWNLFLQDLELQVGALTRVLPEWLPRPRRGGTLRNVVIVSSSVTSGVPPKFLSMYTTVKYAQLGLIRALTTEYAGRGVVINGVAPSMVETRFLERIPGTVRELSAASSPLGRNATPDEVAEVLQLLLSGGRPLLTGANLVLGGGAIF